MSIWLNEYLRPKDGLIGTTRNIAGSMEIDGLLGTSPQPIRAALTAMFSTQVVARRGVFDVPRWFYQCRNIPSEATMLRCAPKCGCSHQAVSRTDGFTSCRTDFFFCFWLLVDSMMFLFPSLGGTPRGTPSHHPFVDGIFAELPPFSGYPSWRAGNPHDSGGKNSLKPPSRYCTFTIIMIIIMIIIIISL